MGLSPPSLFYLLFLSLPLLAIIGSSEDYTTVVFKGCADQNFQDPTGVYAQNLKTLFDTLESQSATAKFYKATSGDGQSAIFGLFQCRGDLSNADCRNCVTRTPDTARKRCGDTIAARVQLTGCYMRYEVSGFKQVPGTQLLEKFCGSTRASGVGFDDKLGTALGEIEKGVGSGNGFYAGSYESVYVLGQCEGDLANADCADCLKTAVSTARSDCGGSITGQIYLLQCYISYTYYPNGVPLKSLTGARARQPQDAQKTVAIVVGVVAGVGLGVTCLLVLKSAFKKREGKYGG